MTGIYKILSNIYSRLQDDESREIFRQRALFSLTNDISYLDTFIKKIPERKYLDGLNSKNAYIFGCGFYGQVLFKYIKKNWAGFSDNNNKLWGGKCCELTVIPPDKLPKDAQVYIAVKYYYDSIKKQLLGYGIKEKNIVNVAKMLVDLGNRQYFDLPSLNHADEEVFVDAGCLNGMTTQSFIQWANNKYRHIYCFEPDPYSAANCNVNLKDLVESGKATVINKAVSRKNGTTSFCSKRNGGSSIGQGDITVETVTLDTLLYNENVTFIKMDIEGEEYNALQGAEGLIREKHPKLAISVYHLLEDIFDIPGLVLSYYPDYKLYLRHYSPFYEETILYAI